MRPASHRNAGQCPNGGGDARRKAVNRARQFFRQARLNEKRRARFWAASPTASPPSFAENPWKARDWSEAEIGQAKRSPYHTSTARRTHLKTATRARWHKQGQLLGEARHDQIGRRNGSPNLARWRNANARPNAPAPKVSPRRRRPEGRTSGGATHNSAIVWDYSRTRPSARGRCAARQRG